MTDPSSSPEGLGIPSEAELSRRSHVAGEGGGGHDGRAREIPFAADPHPVLPVPVEGSDRALAGGQRVRSLPETRSAPGTPDLSAGLAKHRGDRLSAEPRVGP